MCLDTLWLDFLKQLDWRFIAELLLERISCPGRPSFEHCGRVTDLAGIAIEKPPRMFRVRCASLNMKLLLWL
jgi:hypothetical protein